jgi:hypothetical protein
VAWGKANSFIEMVQEALDATNMTDVVYISVPVHIPIRKGSKTGDILELRHTYLNRLLPVAIYVRVTALIEIIQSLYLGVSFFQGRIGKVGGIDPLPFNERDSLVHAPVSQGCIYHFSG